MFSKHHAQPAHSSIHMVTTSRSVQGHHRGLLQYWPILLFVLLSALTQTVGNFF